jgi:hypothetical protein
MSTTTATVNTANAYRQIISNYSNPLEFVREAISNSIDAAATNLTVKVEQPVGPTGQPEIRITLRDDGKGMDARTLERFFNLGDSEKSELRSDAEDQDHLIGEKGFGTKIYLNSRKIEVRTRDKQSGLALKAVSQGHLERIHDISSGVGPQYDVTEEPHGVDGTEIKIFGYNHNDGSKLGHDQLRDYILWFTKFGSVEPLLWEQFPKFSAAKARLANLKLHLRGLGFDPQKHAGDINAQSVTLDFGHPFPEECFDGKALRAKAKTGKASPTDFYCRRFVREDVLKKFPGYRWQAVFSIEGNSVKYQNPMVRRQRYQAPSGAYKVAERYGIWICKDFIPAERVNVLLPGKGTEFLKFHAFFNCQAIRLSADRTSIGPTPPDVRGAIEEQILELVREIFEDEGVAALLEALDEAEFGERTEEQEKKDYARRVKQAKSSASATFKSVELREPQRELGVVSLLAQLLAIEPGLFPFRVLDWNNAGGFDLLARDTTDLVFDDAAKFYVECKQLLTGSFNHTLNNVKYVVCWDTDLENDGVVTAIGGDTRRMVIKSKSVEKPYTQFFLSREDAPNNIEVFVLRRLLEEREKITFHKP